MSGIAGLYKRGAEPVIEAEVTRMTDAIAHRGPDGTFQLVDGGVGLGFCFLKIPSAVSLPQPLTNEDGSIKIICDGRVYNHAALRADLEDKGHSFSSPSDVETLIHLYEEEGERFLDRVNGMYGLALWDARKRKLILARDRIGVKPLYYTKNSSGVLFGSEIKAVLADPSVKRRVNKRGMSDFFGISYIFDGETMFEDVMSLPPGHLFIIDADGKTELRRYWEMYFDPDHAWDEREEAERGLDILREAVRLECGDVEPLGIHLSGGIDSSFITSLAAEDDPDRLITLSAGFREEQYDEREYAQAAAEHAGVRHESIEVYPTEDTFMDTMRKVVWHVDEPTVSPGIHSFYILNDFTSKFVNVVLGGQGSNELLAGYNRYILAQIRDLFTSNLKHLNIPGVVREVREMVGFFGSKPMRGTLKEVTWSSGQRALRIASTYPPDEKKKLFADSVRAELDGYTTEEHYVDSFNNAPAATTIDRMMYLDMKNMMPNMLRILDRTCAAFGIEARTPFLDHNFVEFAASQSDDALLRGTESKYILKKMGDGILLHDTIYQDKSGFAAPVTPWLQGHLRRTARKTIFSPRALDRGYFEPASLEFFVNRFEQTGKGEWQVWMLLLFELWNKQFIDQSE
jgi:asparagine synthase (glutamine-hydrolysing)